MSMSNQLQQPADLSPKYLAEDNSRPLIDVLITFIVIETVFFAMFITSRFILKTYNSIETCCFMPLAYLSCISSCITGVLMIKLGGVGRHIAYHILTDPQTIAKGLKLAVAQEFLYGAAITFPKLAIIALYLRVFLDKWIRRLTWLVGIVIALNGLSIEITILSLCNPISYRWNPTMPNGHCGDRMAFYRFASIPNIASDVAILFLPWSTLYSLHMSNHKKAGIALAFLAGSLGIITATIRFIHYYTRDLFSDPLWYGTDMEIWTVVEPGAYFVCASLTGLRPLLRAVGCSPWYNRLSGWLQQQRHQPRTRKSSSSLLPITAPRSDEVRLPEISASVGGGKISKWKASDISAGSDKLETLWVDDQPFKLCRENLENGVAKNGGWV